MRIVVRSVVARLDVSPPWPAAEPTGRRRITFSPAGGATVILRERRRNRPVEPAEEAFAATA